MAHLVKLSWHCSFECCSCWTFAERVCEFFGVSLPIRHKFLGRLLTRLGGPPSHHRASTDGGVVVSPGYSETIVKDSFKYTFDKDNHSSSDLDALSSSDKMDRQAPDAFKEELNEEASVHVYKKDLLLQAYFKYKNSKPLAIQYPRSKYRKYDNIAR